MWAVNIYVHHKKVTRLHPEKVYYFMRLTQYRVWNLVWEISWSCWKHSTNNSSRIARFMGPTWGPSGADRTQVGPMLTPFILLAGFVSYSLRLIIRCQFWYLWRLSQRELLLSDPCTVKSGDKTDLGRDKVADVLQTTFSNSFLVWKLLPFESNLTDIISQISNQQ